MAGKSRTRLTLVASALALAAALSPPARAQQVIGISAAVRNDVRIRKPGAPLPLPVALRQRVALADQVQTGARSQLQVLLLDKSVFTVGANARLTIDRYVYDPNRSTRSLGATVTKGAFRFMSGRATNGSGSQIRTPVASIGIRGTIVEGVVGEEAMLIATRERGVPANVGGDRATASLIILRGPGRAAQGNSRPGAIDVTAGGRTVTVDRPLLAVYVPRPGAAPVGPFVISAAGLMQVQALLHPSVAQRLGWSQPVTGLADGPAWRPSEPDEPRPLPPRAPGALPGDFPAFEEDAPPGAGVPAFPLPILQPPPPRPQPQPEPVNDAPPPPTPTQPAGPTSDQPPPPPAPPPPPPPSTSFTAPPPPPQTPPPQSSQPPPNNPPPPPSP